MRSAGGGAARFLLVLSLLGGCGTDGDSDIPTAPGLAIFNIRGVYSAPGFWTFEAVREADGTTIFWSCEGRVTVLRQTVTDFLGNFALMPPEERCGVATGDVTSGVIREGAQISFLTTATEQAPDEFFAIPGCVLVTQDPLWTGSVAGGRMVAQRGLTVDCPTDGRLQIIARVDGPRTEVFD